MVKKQTKSILNPEKSLSIRRYCLKLRHNTQNNFPHPKIRSYSQHKKKKILTYSNYKIIENNLPYGLYSMGLTIDKKNYYCLTAHYYNLYSSKNNKLIKSIFLQNHFSHFLHLSNGEFIGVSQYGFNIYDISFNLRYYQEYKFKEPEPCTGLYEINKDTVLIGRNDRAYMVNIYAMKKNIIIKPNCFNEIKQVYLSFDKTKVIFLCLNICYIYNISDLKEITHLKLGYKTNFKGIILDDNKIIFYSDYNVINYDLNQLKILGKFSIEDENEENISLVKKIDNMNYVIIGLKNGKIIIFDIEKNKKIYEEKISLNSILFCHELKNNKVLVNINNNRVGIFNYVKKKIEKIFSLNKAKDYRRSILLNNGKVILGNSNNLILLG
jgi:hypothetical protein